MRQIAPIPTERTLTLKSSKYVPKRLLKRVQQMEQEKAAVRKILGLFVVIIGFLEEFVYPPIKLL
ncbi:hypothetical protein [Aulosira sp. FACHB-615]|uniref:hypothetical protein n=1 Tax=Aulosira sp. FACHB-615 TaxID=2692777 RepID=UPI0016836239|nr:hypothetical protein [Aulosira sp. FACHB-615]MBD2492196.1 hypothetical protein [Aulosira sp. FACHB-615]